VWDPITLLTRLKVAPNGRVVSVMVVRDDPQEPLRHRQRFG
jgi:hypothetical protein